MAVVVLLTGCGGGGSLCSGSALGALGAAGCDAVKANEKPVASIAAPAQAKVNVPIVFDAAGSKDPEGQSLTYTWELSSRPSTSSATLSGASSVKASLIADAAGDYVVRLVVSDGQNASAAVSWTVAVTRVNTSPVAAAGTSVLSLIGVPVTLDGSRSADPEGDLITYAWVVTDRPVGSRAELEGAQTVRPRFTPDVAGSYTFALTVNDGQLSSAPSTVNLVAGSANLAPTANAGARQSAIVGATVSLDGTGSSDANGDRLVYFWTIASQPASSQSVLNNAASPRPSFLADVAGEFVFSLVVHDGTVSSAPSYVAVTVSSANLPPVALAGVDRAAVIGLPVTLNGGGSSDPNGDALGYQWTLVSRPSTSAAILSGSALAPPVTNTQVVSFTPDVVGTYVASLVVSDGRLSSTASVVTVVAKASNQAPVARVATPLSVAANALLTLSGGLSSDPDGDPLSFEWTVLSKPAGSTVKLVGASGSNPVFSADLAGKYILNLVVSDGMLTHSALVTITVTP